MCVVARSGIIVSVVECMSGGGVGATPFGVGEPTLGFMPGVWCAPGRVGWAQAILANPGLTKGSPLGAGSRQLGAGSRQLGGW